MEATDAIKKILSAKDWHDVFTKKSDYKSEYKSYALLLHPDRCKLKNAEDAFKKVTGYRDEIENSYKFTDEAGTVSYSDFKIIFEGNESLLKKSYDNYNKLMSLTDKASLHFKKYIPTSAILDGNTLTFTVPYKIVSMNDLTLPLEHSRWALNRMFEFSSWLDEVGFSHCGINPGSMFIVPESHGLICASFYHMTKIGTNLSTISAKYSSWYPAYILDKRTDSKGRSIKPKATSIIDAELSKRTAIYLLGDKSGNGIVLKRNLQPELVNFLITSKPNAYTACKEYIDLIHKLYGKPKFVELVI
jgi:hypothetical protein